MSGVAVTVGKSSVSWFSSTQNIVTLSTTEAEYVALGGGVKEALFVDGVLSFIIPSISENCIKVFVDNDGAISLANNPLSSARAKHIYVCSHFVREITRSKTILVEYVLLGCGSFVRGRKRKKGDSIPFILSRRDYMPRLPDECP